MKGILILTEGRSGSNWLGSLLKNTGYMGLPDEWLDPELLGSEPAGWEQYFEAVIAKGTTGNGRFAVKIFPRHLHWAQAVYGFDFLAECMRRHEVGLIRLSRADRLRQAISYMRGMKTGQWTSRVEKSTDEAYDFDAICQAYIYIDRSEAFWKSYTEIAGHPLDGFVYEDLIGDPQPFILSAAGHLDVPAPEAVRTDLKIQRDERTEEWVQRFREDAKTKNLLAAGPTGRTAARTMTNLQRFFQKKPLMPF